jgi:hypothetical protein
LDLNLRSRLDLREDPQLIDKDPQPIPKISKVVGSLQYYIRRPSHGERHMEFERYLTYDLMGSDIEDIEGIKLMISEGR